MSVSSVNLDESTVYNKQVTNSQHNTRADFSKLPEEIILEIFSSLDPKGVLSFSEVNKKCNRLANEAILWTNLFKKTFKISSCTLKTKHEYVAALISLISQERKSIIQDLPVISEAVLESMYVLSQAKFLESLADIINNSNFEDDQIRKICFAVPCLKNATIKYNRGVVEYLLKNFPVSFCPYPNAC